MNGQKKNVIFLVVTELPFTYVSANVLKKFGFETSKNSVWMKLNGTEGEIYISPGGSHFSELNILGANFLTLFFAKVIIKYELEPQIFKIIFNNMK